MICPFCENDEYVHVEYDDENKMLFVRCGNCGAQGPTVEVCDRAKTAKELWEKVKGTK